MAFIEAKEIKIRNLLSNAQEAYKVPSYQRPFAWTEEQWRELFDDLNLIGANEIHFLGSIVVVPEGPHRHGINYFEIVDGQQRVATILLFLAAIRDLLKERGNEGFSKHIDDTFIFAKDWEGDREVKVPKLTLGRLDNEAFKCILNQNPRGDSHLVLDCYNFFKKNISNYSGDNLQELVNKMLDKVAIVHINALSYLNAFRLFETLNDRGLELSAADLIKNFLLMRVSQNQKIFDEVIEEWGEMYDKVRDKEPVKFIRRHLLSSFSGKVSERKLYEELKSKIEKDSWDDVKISNYAKNLNAMATIYKNIYDATFPSEKINNKLRELHLIEVAPSYTLLLKVMPLYEKQILTDDDILNILNLIEAFHIRWGICGQATSRLDDIYNKICIDLGDLTDASSVLTVINKNYSEAIKTIGDDFFYRSFLKGSFKAGETRTKYILWKSSEPTGETLLNVNEIQTEHIMPQKLSEEWMKYLIDKTGLSAEEIKRKHAENLNRIGNLTIIKGKWNNKMSNRIFDEKKEDYRKSEISITNKLLNYEKWTFDEIEKRSEELAKIGVERIWKWQS